MRYRRNIFIDGFEHRQIMHYRRNIFIDGFEHRQTMRYRRNILIVGIKHRHAMRYRRNIFIVGFKHSRCKRINYNKKTFWRQIEIVKIAGKLQSFRCWNSSKGNLSCNLVSIVGFQIFQIRFPKYVFKVGFHSVFSKVGFLIFQSAFSK